MPLCAVRIEVSEKLGYPARCIALWAQWAQIQVSREPLRRELDFWVIPEWYYSKLVKMWDLR